MCVSRNNLVFQATSSRAMTSRRTQHESCHPFVILSALIGINIQSASIYSSFAVLYQPLRDNYDASRETIGWAYSIMGIVASLAGISCTPFIKQYGTRNVLFVGVSLRTVGYLLAIWPSTVYGFYLCYGLVLGLGLGITRIACNNFTLQSFSTRRDQMARMASLGFYIGEAVSPLVASQSLQQYGLGGGLIFQAGIQIHGFVFAMLIPRQKSISAKKPTRSLRESTCQLLKDLADPSLFRDAHFVSLCVLRLMWSSCKFTLLIHIVNAANTIGEFGDRANNLPALVSTTAMGFGVLSIVLVKWLNPMLGFVLGMASVSVASFLVAYGTYPMLVASMILLGCDEGMLADFTGSYKWTFITSGTIGLCSLLVAMIAHILGQRKHKQHTIIEENGLHKLNAEENVNLLGDDSSDCENDSLTVRL